MVKQNYPHEYIILAPRLEERVPFSLPCHVLLLLGRIYHSLYLVRVQGKYLVHFMHIIYICNVEENTLFICCIILLICHISYCQVLCTHIHTSISEGESGHIPGIRVPLSIGYFSRCCLVAVLPSSWPMLLSGTGDALFARVLADLTFCIESCSSRHDVKLAVGCHRLLCGVYCLNLWLE